jgi:hypothetical protein
MRAAAGAQREDARLAERRQRLLQRRVHLYVCELPVIEAGPAQARFVERKPQRLHQVQVHARVRAQANDVASVGRNFRLVQDQADHIV